MEEEVREDILDILRKSYEAIKEDDVKALKDLSNHTLHDASIFQDEYSVAVAVIIYSLSKIFERSNFRVYKDWSLFYKICLEDLKKAEKFLAENKIEEYENVMKDLFNIMDKLGSNLKRYIVEVIDGAKINKASRVHEHGISIGRTAELLGVSQWDLMDYVGKTGIADVELALTKRVGERIKLTRRLFGVS